MSLFTLVVTLMAITIVGMAVSLVCVVRVGDAPSTTGEAPGMISAILSFFVWCVVLVGLFTLHLKMEGMF